MHFDNLLRAIVSNGFICRLETCFVCKVNCEKEIAYNNISLYTYDRNRYLMCFLDMKNMKRNTLRLNENKTVLNLRTVINCSESY